MEATRDKYRSIAKGTEVRVTRPFRVAKSISGPDAFSEWIDYPAGMVGTVVTVSNAGFRGIEHQVAFAENGPDGRRLLASHVAGADLEVVS